jgi:hypothetical protein
MFYDESSTSTLRQKFWYDIQNLKWSFNSTYEAEWGYVWPSAPNYTRGICLDADADGGWIWRWDDAHLYRTTGRYP